MMATKEQERKALEKIRKIIADLGENSYIGTALDGCLEIASDNIEMDWACSMKGRYEAAEKNIREWKQRYEEEHEELTGQKAVIEAITQERDYARKEAQRNGEELGKWVDKWGELHTRWIEQSKESCKKEKELTAQIEAAQDEIIRLKAKLYDLITA